MKPARTAGFVVLVGSLVSATGSSGTQGFTTSEEETDEMRRSTAELQRIHRDGRKTFPPVVEIVFDVEDGGALRRVRYEHLFGPRAARRYKPGRTVPPGSTGRRGRR